MLVDKLTERNGHLLFDSARVVDMARDTEELCAGVSLATKGVKPLTTSPDDGWGDGDSLNVGNSRWAAEQTNCSRERWLQTGFAGLALEGFNKGCLLSADVGAHATVHENIEIVTGAARVLAEETSFVCFLDGSLKDGSLVVKLTTDVDVCCRALYIYR